MKRFLMVAATVLIAAAARTDAADYDVYRGSMKAPFDYHRSGPSAGQNHAGSYASLVLLEVSDGGKTPALNRMAMVSFWTTQGQEKQYSVDTFTDGIALSDFGNGTGSLVSLQPRGLPKVADPGVQMTVLTFKVGDGPPKKMKGTSLIVAPDERVQRCEVSLSRDAKITAVARETAAANPGRPFQAALDVLIAAVEASGYTPSR